MQLIRPDTNFDFMGRIKTFGSLSIGLVVLSLIGVATRGFSWGIDFAGGTELQLRFDKQIETGDIRSVLEGQGFDKNEVQPFGAPEHHEFLVRIERVTSLSAEQVDKLREEALARFGPGVLHSMVFQASEGDRIAMTFNVEADAGKAAPGAGVHPAAPAAADPDGGTGAAPDGGPAAAATPDGGLTAVEPDGGDGAGARPADEATATDDTKKVTGLDAVAARFDGEIRAFLQERGIALRGQDALQFGQVRQGKVQVLVYFRGVADRIVEALGKSFGSVENRRTDYVDSNVSKELRTDGLLAIIYALLGILVYIAIRFDFYFSPGAVVALIHDVCITMGVFAWTQLEFNLTTVAALLTIIGYSLNDTIVVYDRIRETVPAEEKAGQDVARYVNRAVNDTLSRTLLTSLTTLLVVIALLVFATGVIQTFGIALCIGVAVGTYSSIFVASPVYVILRRMVPAK